MKLRYIIPLFLSLLAFAAVQNVTTYGAKGDGTTNDTTAIQNAITAAVAGDEIFFPCAVSGVYKVTSALSITGKSNITFDGAIGCPGGRVKIAFSGLGTGTQAIHIGTTGTSAPVTDIPGQGAALLASTADQAKSFTAGSGFVSTLSPGDYVLLNEGGIDGNCSGGLPQCNSGNATAVGCEVDGCRTDIGQVVTASGTTVTLAKPLNHPYDPVANVATVVKVTVVSGLNVHDLICDGGGTASTCWYVTQVVNSTFTNLTGQHVLGGGFNLGASGQAIGGYGNTVSGLTITTAGNNGGFPNGGAAWGIYQSSYSTANGVTVSGLNNPAFGGIIGQSTALQVSNYTVDMTGAGVGRGTKLTSNAHTIFTTISVKNANGGDNCWDIEYYTHHTLLVSGTFSGCNTSAINSFGQFDNYLGILNTNVTNGANGQVAGYNQGLSTGGNKDLNATIGGGSWLGPGTGGYYIYARGNNMYVYGGSFGAGNTSTGGLNMSSSSTSGNCVMNNGFNGPLQYAYDGAGSTGLEFGNTYTGSSVIGGFTVAKCAWTGPTNVNFGTVGVGVTSSPQVITVNNPTSFTITTSQTGTFGDFAVTSTTCGTLAAGASCTVTLTATPSVAGVRSGWLAVYPVSTGGTLYIPLSVTGGTVVNPTLTISPSPANGVVTSSPSGINCPTTCSAQFTTGTVITLTATPNGGYTFSGWSGACSGTGACVVTLNTSQNVGATFTTTSTPIIITSPSCGSPPCLITGGTQGVIYTYPLVAAGGTPPYTWNISVGALPSGLALSSVGCGTDVNCTVQGTPVLVGTTNFTIRACDTIPACATIASGIVIVTPPTSGNVQGTGSGSGRFVINYIGVPDNTSLTPIVYPFTPPTLGGQLGQGLTFNDPLFGTFGVRVTDKNFDPALAGNDNNSYSVSNGGSADDEWFSTDNRLMFVQSQGSTTYLVGINPVNGQVTRPYSAYTSGCPNPGGNCSNRGGWSTPSAVEFSRVDPCTVYEYSGTTIYKYVFGHDVVPFANSCSNAITGPPVRTQVFNFIENSPASCVGTACNCLPSDFGTPTWQSVNGTVDGDESFGVSYSSVNYHSGAGTGQGSGFYTVVWDKVKGCMSYNTMTGSILADPGWTGGSGLSCTGTQCTGTATIGDTYTIHNSKSSLDGRFQTVARTTCTGGCPSNVPNTWITGTTNVYYSEVTQQSGHWCTGYLGQLNYPGNVPIWQFRYRTEPNTPPPGTPIGVNTTPTSPVPTVNLDNHCSWVMDNASDTAPFAWSSVSSASSGSPQTDGYLPFDQPLSAWWNEIDLSDTNGSGLTHRKALTFNTGYSIFFTAQNNIITASMQGNRIAVGTDWFNQWGNSRGTSSSCTPNGPAWRASHVYPSGYIIKPVVANNAGLYSYKNTGGSCTSGPTTPGTFTQTVGNSTSDGSCFWQNIDVSTGVNSCRVDVVLWFTNP